MYLNIKWSKENRIIEMVNYRSTWNQTPLQLHISSIIRMDELGPCTRAESLPSSPSIKYAIASEI